MTLALRQRLLTTTLLVGAGLVAAPAIAQTAPQTDGSPTTIANPTGPAEAQPVPSVAATGAPVEEPTDIVVTGSRLSSPNLTSVSPITVVTSQDIKLQGVTRVEDLLNSLPQVFAAQNSTLSNGASGTATVDLRGLGATRTLVLLNGRRLMPGDPNSSAADLNFVPSSLIKRVEVLTGGASATYGADAVAGVVNFIMDTSFTGIRVDGNLGVYQHNNRNSVLPPLLNARQASFSGYGYPKNSVADGGSYDATVSIGAGFDDNRGHVMGYFGYRKVRPILQSNRDYSACTIQNTGAALASPRRLNPAAPLQCGGSATSATGTVFYHTASTSSSTVGALGPGTLTQGTLNRYNFAPLNYFQRPDERYTGGVFANYEVNSSIKPYLEFMFMDDRTVAQIAPSGDFGNTLTINCDNAYMSASQRTQICNPNNLVVDTLGTFPLVPGTFVFKDPTGTQPVPGPINFTSPNGSTYNQAFFQLLRRNVEGGPRVSDLQHTSFRGLVGSRGDLGKSWKYDGYYQYGRTNYSQVYSNEFSVRRITNALDAVVNPANGQIVCRTTLTPGGDPNCVPYDVFGGTPSAASLAYVSATGFQKGITTEQVASFSLTGALGDYGLMSPASNQGVSIALGAEYRRESLDLQTDNAFSTGDLTGQGAATLPVKGSYDVKELFGELRVPLVSESFFYDLSLEGGYRYSSYGISNGKKFSTNTYKLGIEFAPIRDIRVRGGYNRAVRAPNIQELFAPQIVALDGATDPCSGRPLTTADAGCLLQGLRVGQQVTANPAAQYNGFVGGNPNLTPEVSTTKSLGLVFQPTFIPRFAVTVDYFDIKVKKAIQGFGADAILASCTTDLNPLACGLIHRNAAGSLWLTSDGFVTDLPANIGSVQTRGIEVNGSYSHSLGGLGNISASMVGTYLKNFKVDNGLTQIYDCAGYFGPTCGGPRQKWRHKARVTLETPVGVGISLQWRYMGPVDVEYKNPSSSLKGNFYNYSSHIAAQNYFDLATTFNAGNHMAFRIGVNNILDRQPPLVTSGSGTFGASACAGTVCNGNTYPGTYDALGRYLYAGATLNF